jgi:hypothetical protein
MHFGGFFPPSATAAAVPLWRLITFITIKGPSFLVALFFCPEFKHILAVAIFPGTQH